MKVKTELLLASLAVFYIVLTFPLGLMGLTAVLSGLLYTMCNSITYVLGFLVVMIVARFLTVLLKPQPLTNISGFGKLLDGFKNKEAFKAKEGFQPKEPVSIHQRIVTDKRSEPLQPKVDEVTGVLESAKILDSLQIANLNKAESGGSSSTLPASLNGIPPIRTPREEEIIKNTFNDLAPRGNPFLQNGADDTSVNTALSSRGADLKMHENAGEVAGIKIGNGTV
jgi:hypothetical protein